MASFRKPTAKQLLGFRRSAKVATDQARGHVDRDIERAQVRVDEDWFDDDEYHRVPGRWITDDDLS